jgi:hypothetical protein
VTVWSVRIDARRRSSRRSLAKPAVVDLGGHLVLQVRTRVLNDGLADDFHRWFHL